MCPSRSLTARETVAWSTNSNSATTSSVIFVRKYITVTFTACRRDSPFGRPWPRFHTIRSSIRATSSSNCSWVSPVVACWCDGISGSEDTLMGTLKFSRGDHCLIHYDTPSSINLLCDFLHKPPNFENRRIDTVKVEQSAQKRAFRCSADYYNLGTLHEALPSSGFGPPSSIRRWRNVGSEDAPPSRNCGWETNRQPSRTCTLSANATVVPFICWSRSACSSGS